MVYFDIEHLDTDNPILISKSAPYKTFEAVSPIDDKFILSPLNAFLIQRGVTQSSVTFHPEGRQSDDNFSFTNNSRALRRQQLRLQRIVYDVALQRHTEQQADVQLASTRIIVTPRATEQYDRGQDAPFISLDDNATALYSRTAGLRYSFNELPPTTATVELGTHLAEAGSYTLSMNVRTRGASLSDIPSHLWLTDSETGSQTDLLTDSYTFTVSEPCTLNSRFVLQLSDGVNAIPCIEASPQQSDRLYDLQGRRIDTPAKGFYIKGHRKYVK
ncbi:MAG: hypothetical protein IJ081_05415 [Prevotella sp.]|nr:hypothetical protein [Prevotella sp.]